MTAYMRVAVVASSPTPFAPGGAERLWNGLVRAINEETPHAADLIKLPVRQTPLPALLASYRAYAELDLSGFDRVITTRYPAWLVGHPNHVVYMIHKLRPVYDRYPESLPQRIDADDPDLRGLQHLMREGHGREALPEFFDRFSRAAAARAASDPLFRVPGPFAREVVRWLDAVALDPQSVRAHFAISRTVAARPGYFPAGVEARAAYPPSDLEGFACRGFAHLFAPSRLVPHKRVGLVVEAMRHVSSPVPLKVAGEGPDLPAIRRLASSDGRVELLGHVATRDLINLYADAMAVVFVPKDEDLGYVALEAMRSGKAVVTCRDSGGPTELVEDGVTGFVVDPTPEALGAALERLAADPESARRMGATGAGRVRAVSWAETVRALLEEGADAPRAAAGPIPRAVAEERAADDAPALRRERAILRRQRAWILARTEELEAAAASARADARTAREETKEAKARLQAVYDTKTWRARKRILPIARALLPSRGATPARPGGNPGVQAPESPPRPPSTAPALPRGAVLAFFPDIRDRNPYQAMLYARLGDAGISAAAVAGPEELLGTTHAGPLVFHLHWTAPVLRGARSELEAVRRAAGFVEALDALKARGAKVAWTVHNVLPHESRFPHLEAELCQEIALRADLVHVMCARTNEEVAPHYALPPERVRVVAHGSYLGVYPNEVAERDARARLGLGEADTVLCSLGGIRAYKGLGRLLDAFDGLRAERPESRLIVAGPLGRFDGVEDLAARCEATPGIVARLDRVPDEELQVYLNASDAMVLAHRTGLNSGALMLALSFARPVIAPRVGCIGEAVTPDVGRTFDPDAPGDLEAALRRAVELKAPGFREAALARAQAYPPEAMAADFGRLIADLVAGGGANAR